MSSAKDSASSPLSFLLKSLHRNHFSCISGICAIHYRIEFINQEFPKFINPTGRCPFVEPSVLVGKYTLKSPRDNQYAFKKQAFSFLLFARIPASSKALGPRIFPHHLILYLTFYIFQPSHYQTTFCKLFQAY